MSEYGSASASFSVSAKNSAPLASAENSSILALGHLAPADENGLHPDGCSHVTKAGYSPTKVTGAGVGDAALLPPKRCKDMYIDIDLSDVAIDRTEPTKATSFSSMMVHLLSSNDTSLDTLSASNRDTSSFASPCLSSEDLPSLTISTKSNKVQPLPKSPLLPTSFKAPTPAVVKSESSCCRICQEGKSEEPLISPCYCSGTMGKVHLSCVETWLQLMHRSSCELCQYEFPVERIPQPTYKFFLNPGSSTEFANLMCDIACFLILTPLLIITMFLCTRGVKYYDAHGKTGSMFAVVTLIGSLLVVYVSWAVLAFLYHYRIWRTWRENTAVIRMSLYKSPKTEVKPPKPILKNAGNGKWPKRVDTKGVKRGNEATQTEIVGSKMASSSDFVYPDYDSRKRLLAFAPVGVSLTKVPVCVTVDEAQAGGFEMCHGSSALCKENHSQGAPGDIPKHQDTQQIKQSSSTMQFCLPEPTISAEGAELTPGGKRKFQNIFSPKVFPKKKRGKGKHGRRTFLQQMDYVSGLYNDLNQANDVAGRSPAKEKLAKKNIRLKREKPTQHCKPQDNLPANLGNTLTFKIEPSNPAQLVGFRFLNK